MLVCSALEWVRKRVGLSCSKNMWGRGWEKESLCGLLYYPGKSSEYGLNHPHFIIKGFWTIVFIFSVISTTFRPIYPPAFFMGLSNPGTFTFFTESTEIACSDSVSHNRIQVLSIPVLLLACSQDWTCNFRMIVSLEA